MEATLQMEAQNAYYKSALKVCQNKQHCIVCTLQNILNLTDWSFMIQQRILYLLNVNPVLYCFAEPQPNRRAGGYNFQIPCLFYHHPWSCFLIFIVHQYLNKTANPS